MLIVILILLIGAVVSIKWARPRLLKLRFARDYYQTCQLLHEFLAEFAPALRSRPSKLGCAEWATNSRSKMPGVSLALLGDTIRGGYASRSERLLLERFVTYSYHRGYTVKIQIEQNLLFDFVR
jgi:hypothetical protein